MYYNNAYTLTDDDHQTVLYEIERSKMICCTFRGCDGAIRIFRHLNEKHRILNPYQCNYPGKKCCTEKFTDGSLLCTHKSQIHEKRMGLDDIADHISRYIIKGLIPDTTTDDYLGEVYCQLRTKSARIIWKIEPGKKLLWIDIIDLGIVYMKRQGFWQEDYNHLYDEFFNRSIRHMTKAGRELQRH